MYTYGPVPSRRLGRSLGVSPIPPKTCSYSCVYCQLGRTTHLVTKRQSFYPKEYILSEITRNAESSKPDYITFVGDGEPTLCADLGWLINQCKKRLPFAIAVITNGSLFFREDVRQDLMQADVVLPSLDAGNEEVFRRINRPHRGIRFDAMLQGQIAFRKEYSGQIWLEVMLVSGMNDSDQELQKIREAVDLLRPDRIYIASPIRPPAESWVEVSPPERILNALRAIGGSAPLIELESGEFGLQKYRNAREAIIEIGSRHPLPWEQAVKIVQKFSAGEILEQMLENNELIIVHYRKEEYLLPSRLIRGK